MGTFQVHLVSDGNIVFNYNNLVAPTRAYGQSATIGIQENNAGNFAQHSFGTGGAEEDAGIRSGYAIIFSYDDGSNYNKSEPNTDVFWDILLYKVGTVQPPTKPYSPRPSVGVTTSTNPTLSWSSENATNYTVRVSKNGDLSGASSNLTTESSLSLSDLSADTTYYWHVIARNEGGEAHSDVWNFTTSSNIVNLTYNAGANGNITGIGFQTILYGESGFPVEAIPDSGYRFVRWSDGSVQNPRTDEDVMQDVNVTAEFDIIQTSSPRSSDPSRRVSVSPGQPPESVTSTYTSVKHVMGGTSVEYDLSDTGSPVLGISFDAKDNEGIVVAKVQVLSDRPEGVSVPPGRQYQLMNIDVGSEGTISSHNADNIRINFKVSWDWIRENSIDPSTIRLTRYHDGEWQELPTGKVSDDGQFIHFVAETPGFSIFSVVGDELGATWEEKPADAAFFEEATEVPLETEDKDTPGFTGLMGLLFVAVACLVSRRSGL